MSTIDLHVDTLLKLQRTNNTGDLGINNDTSVDLKKLFAGRYSAQFFAMFPLSDNNFKEDNIVEMSQYELIENMINSFYCNLDRYSDFIAFAGNYFDLLSNMKERKVSAFLTLEDGAVIDNDLKKLDYYYSQGVSLISLTWNYENCFGYPNSTDPNIMNKGLKPFGREAVEYMNELGMIIDVSHLSDGGFYDVIKTSKKPVAATHSNARAITPHPRNLTDDMIKALANAGGICGVNFCSSFLNSRNDNYSKIEDIVKHLNHLKNVGGEEFVALGSDYDGISSEVEITGPQDIRILYDALSKSGWNERQIENLKFQNVVRFIKDTLK